MSTSAEVRVENVGGVAKVDVSVVEVANSEPTLSAPMEEVEVRNPPPTLIFEVVALYVEPKMVSGVHAKVPVSEPQENVPLVEAFTSQEAELRPETMRLVEEAMPETERLVVVALVVVELMTLSWVMVEEAEEMNPWVSWIKVEVELPSMVGVKGKILESELDEILLLKVLQSAEAKQPGAAAVAVSQSMSSTVLVSPSPAVMVLVTFPLA